MSREWIHSRNKLSQEYKDGIQSFIDVAQHHQDANNETLCPCVKCLLYESHPLSMYLNDIETVFTRPERNLLSNSYVYYLFLFFDFTCAVTLLSHIISTNYNSVAPMM